MLGSKSRMNFLKRAGAEFTYKSITVLLAVWIAFLIFIGVVQHLRVIYNTHLLERAREHVAELDEEKERRIALARLTSAQQGVQGAQEDLYRIFSHPPRWSAVLSQLAQRVPHQLKLTSITTEEARPGATVMDIKGAGTSVRVITDFVIRLEASKFFRAVELISTEWNTGGRNFDFEIAADVLASAR